jgi:aldose 1-epimerase
LNSAGKSFGVNARVVEETTGRVLEVLSDQPGVQFYSGNFLDGTIIGKGGVKYEFRHGFCLEPQHFPDSPNKPAWPTVRLDPGQKYTAKIAYRFSVK